MEGVLIHQCRWTRAYHNMASNSYVLWADRLRQRCALCPSNVDNALVMYLRIALRIEGIGQLVMKNQKGEVINV